MDQYRKTPRAEWLSYNEGQFFITVCTRDMIHFFGEIYGDEMHLSPIGMLLDSELSSPETHHPHIHIPLYVVMPNHFHAIVHIDAPDEEGGLPVTRNDRCLAGYSYAARHVPTGGRNTPLLSSYVASLKSAVTRLARKIDPAFAWHSRYHDHLIRGERDERLIADYISNNVGRWVEDRFNLK